MEYAIDDASKASESYHDLFGSWLCGLWLDQERTIERSLELKILKRNKSKYKQN